MRKPEFPAEAYYTVENTDNVIIRLCRKRRRGFRRRRPRKAASYTDSSPLYNTLIENKNKN